MQQWMGSSVLFVTLAACGAFATMEGRKPTGRQQTPPPGALGFTDTPRLPGLPWRVHDRARPHPPIVTPGSTPGAPPSDAIVLFDGSGLGKWSQLDERGGRAEPRWPVRDGYFETAPRTGPLATRERFGDVQLHVEWAAPLPVRGSSQDRGNSGIFLMGLYEVQVLDSYDNMTYADGQAAALYGQWPPLANAARKPGEWQTYDIVFEAPRFENGKLVSPAYQTVFWNGVMVHNRRAVMGRTVYREVPRYTPHEPERPLSLQDHGNPVRYRNIWARRLH